MSWGPDKNGVDGVFLGKNVVACAGSAIEDVVTQVGRWAQAGRGHTGSRQVDGYAGLVEKPQKWMVLVLVVLSSRRQARSATDSRMDEDCPQLPGSFPMTDASRFMREGAPALPPTLSTACSQGLPFPLTRRCPLPCPWRTALPIPTLPLSPLPLPFPP
eukprot:360861-Chlamydomonas_euryale.AAC.9